MCPVLYLVASESTWWQSLSNDHFLPDHVVRVEIEGSHFVHLSNLGAVVGEIRRFLDENDL